jgi:hypothetical protein
MPERNGRISLESVSHSDSDQKHLFVGSENRSALITQFQLFATAGSDGFLGTIQRGGRPTTTSISVIAI